MKIICTAVTVTILFSCNKGDNTNCQNIQNAKASTNGPVTIGDSLKVFTQEVGGYRVYSWHGPENFRSQEPRNNILNAELKNEGWYYLSIANNECETRVDSVYADIKLKQGTPPCTVTNNTCTYNNLANDTYSNIQKLLNPTYRFLSLSATGAGGVTMDVFFHDYWKTHEPEDGIYATIDIPSFGIDRNYNKVFISTIKSSVYFSNHANQTVYVNHVNGKLQVRFCNLSMGGNNGGASFTTIASANLIQQ